MKRKLLTERQQIGIFNCAAPLALLTEYISYANDLRIAADYKNTRIEYKRGNLEMGKKLESMHLTAEQMEAVDNLTSADASQIYRNRGPVYPSVLVKMMEVFPKDVSKKLLLQYLEHCSFKGDAIPIKAFEVYGKEAKNMMLPHMGLTPKLFEKILATFSKDETKDILIELTKMGQNAVLDGDIEESIWHIFSGEDLKAILSAFIKAGVWIDEESYLKLFKLCTPEEMKELLKTAIENDMEIWYQPLKKIVEFFPKKDAEELVEAFWKTSPGGEYVSEREEIEAMLAEKK